MTRDSRIPCSRRMYLGQDQSRCQSPFFQEIGKGETFDTTLQQDYIGTLLPSKPSLRHENLVVITGWLYYLGELM